MPEGGRPPCFLVSIPSFLPSSSKGRPPQSCTSSFSLPPPSSFFFCSLLQGCQGRQKEAEGSRGSQREASDHSSFFLIPSSFFPCFLPSFPPSFLPSSRKGRQRGSNGRQREAEVASSFFISPFFRLVVFCSSLPSDRPSLSCSSFSFLLPPISFLTLLSAPRMPREPEGGRGEQREPEGRSQIFFIIFLCSFLPSPLPSFLLSFFCPSFLSGAEGGRGRQKQTSLFLASKVSSFLLASFPRHSYHTFACLLSVKRKRTRKTNRGGEGPKKGSKKNRAVSKTLQVDIRKNIKNRLFLVILRTCSPKIVCF